jgi:dihydrofolate reductase
MRRIKVGSLVSFDGQRADPQAWALDYFDEQAVAESLEQLERTDAMLMGRGAYEYFQPTWPNATGPYMDRINAMRKLVFSSSLDEVAWSNAELVRGDAVEHVRALEGEYVIYGFTRLAESLLAAGLVDELDFAIHPLILGTRTPLTLVASEPRRNGVVSIKVRPNA